MEVSCDIGRFWGAFVRIGSLVFAGLEERVWGGCSRWSRGIGGVWVEKDRLDSCRIFI